jgi:hypothetical protein
VGIELPRIDLQPLVVDEGEPFAVRPEEEGRVTALAFRLEHPLDVVQGDAEVVAGVGQVGPQRIGGGVPAAARVGHHVAQQLAHATPAEVRMIHHDAVAADLQRTEHGDAQPVRGQPR